MSFTTKELVNLLSSRKNRLMVDRANKQVSVDALRSTLETYENALADIDAELALIDGETATPIIEKPKPSYNSKKAQTIKTAIEILGTDATERNIDKYLKMQGFGPANGLMTFMQKDSVVVSAGKGKRISNKGRFPTVYKLA